MSIIFTLEFPLATILKNEIMTSFGRLNFENNNNATTPLSQRAHNQSKRNLQPWSKHLEYITSTLHVGGGEGVGKMCHFEELLR